MLDLSNNNFDGVIPGWVGKHPSLGILLLRANQFSGTFPDQLCSLRQSMIDLSVNNLSGRLSSCFDPMNFAKEVFDKIDTTPHSIEATDTEWSSSSYFTTNTSIGFDYYDVHVKNQRLIGIPHQKVEFTQREGLMLMNVVFLFSWWDWIFLAIGSQVKSPKR